MHIVSPNNRQAVSISRACYEETTIGKGQSAFMKITAEKALKHLK